MISAGRFMIGADHPSLPGHFPGRPVVPGVIVLDAACGLILQLSSGVRLAGFAHVKFLTPVLAGHVVDVVYEQQAVDRVSFSCHVAGSIVARGVARLAAA